MTEYHGAVLIIGSLWWDNGKREQWRTERLAKEQKIFVSAPIRYGRISGGRRRNTYTMVFSNLCYQEGMGKALLVPFKVKTKDFDGLIFEAKKLWKSEGGIEDRISGTWGAVGLLVNPESALPTQIINDWKKFYKGQEIKPDFQPVRDEPPSLADDGMLMLEWLEDVENKKVTDFDFILATATLPNVEEYPSSEIIAKACADNHYTKYFDKNQEYGIITFQDDEIMQLLHPKK